MNQALVINIGKKAVKWPFMAGISFMSLFVTIRILLVILATFSNHPQMPETLPNGFKYIKSPNEYRGKVITDSENNIIIHEYVTRVRWKDDFVYGVRKGISLYETYYFVCNYGDDCSKNQNYSYEEYRKLKDKYNLPDLNVSIKGMTIKKDNPIISYITDFSGGTKVWLKQGYAVGR